jgi:hypothetical protein
MTNSSNSAPLGRSASVMRYWCDVADRRNVESRGLQRPHRRLPTTTWPFHKHNYGAHSKIGHLACCRLRRHLGCEWRSLTRTLKADRTSTGPRDHSSLWVGNCDDRVVEGRMNMSYAFRNTAACSSSSCGGCGGARGRYSSSCAHWTCSWPVFRWAARSRRSLLSILVSHVTSNNPNGRSKSLF